MWGETLGIDVPTVSFEPFEFADYLPLIDDQGVNGPFRLGWGMDYPHPQNYWQWLLDSRFVPPAGSNSTFYINPEYDAKIDEANAVVDIDVAPPLPRGGSDCLRRHPVDPDLLRVEPVRLERHRGRCRDGRVRPAGSHLIGGHRLKRPTATQRRRTVWSGILEMPLHTMVPQSGDGTGLRPSGRRSTG